MADDDRTRGLYSKFRVERLDGSSAPGGRHDGCFYFVLDARHDAYAVPALRAYADACEAEYPQLARDLRALAATLLATPSKQLYRGGDATR